jgi:hypothetical protein
VFCPIVLEDVKPEKDNSKIIYGYCESATMDQALKALVYLQNRQMNRILNPNNATPLRKCTAITETLRKYQRDLVYGELVNHRNWSASCTVRNTYTIDEHVRYAMKYIIFYRTGTTMNAEVTLRMS